LRTEHEGIEKRFDHTVDTTVSVSNVHLTETEHGGKVGDNVTNDVIGHRSRLYLRVSAEKVKAGGLKHIIKVEWRVIAGQGVTTLFSGPIDVPRTVRWSPIVVLLLMDTLKKICLKLSKPKSPCELFEFSVL
jgi:hypothetical protein